MKQTMNYREWKKEVKKLMKEHGWGKVWIDSYDWDAAKEGYEDGNSPEQQVWEEESAAQ